MTRAEIKYDFENLDTATIAKIVNSLPCEGVLN